MPTTVIHQAAGVPFRNGRICLVTTSSGKGLGIPKGIIDPGNTAIGTVLQEAWEEAGLRGEVVNEPIGTYRYEKWSSVCHVTVFVMTVTEEVAEWPEKAVRRRLWFDVAEAVERISNADLRDLVARHLSSK